MHNSHLRQPQKTEVNYLTSNTVFYFTYFTLSGNALGLIPSQQIETYWALPSLRKGTTATQDYHTAREKRYQEKEKKVWSNTHRLSFYLSSQFERDIMEYTNVKEDINFSLKGKRVSTAYTSFCLIRFLMQCARGVPWKEYLERLKFSWKLPFHIRSKMSRVI